MRISLFILFLIHTLSFGQQFKVDVSASTQNPAMNQEFTLIYTLKLVNGSLTNPKIIVTAPKFNSFKVINKTEGPARGGFGGFGSGISIYEYKVVLQPTQKGSFEIDPVAFSVNNNAVQSIKVPIQVGEKDPNISAKPKGNANIFATIELSSTKIYLGESVVATYKVYSRYYSESSNDYSFPKPKDIWAEELKPGKQGWTTTTERLNNTNYKVFTIKKELLYPQRSGDIKVPSFDMSLIVQASFWDSGERISITSNSPIIKVSPLPSPKPENFSGLVGDFKLETKLSAENAKTDEAIDLYIKISGRGNLNSMVAPKLNFPKEFELLSDPELKDNTTVTSNGISGSREYNYVLIPRVKGAFVIPSVEFSYFDSNSKTYKSLKGETYTVSIAQGEKTAYSGKTISPSSKEVSFLNEDIRYIKEKTKLTSSKKYFFGTPLFYTLTISLFILCLVFYFVLFQRRKTLSDKNYQKQQLLKIALEKIKESKNLTGSDSVNQLTGGLYDYLSACLNLSISDLNKEQIEKKLTELKINETAGKELFNAINEIEMAKYAGISSGNIIQLTEKLVGVLNQINHEK
ncbi:MAG: BatD family protein [Flavobacteriales bacterium]